MNWQLKTFKQLSADQLYQLLKLRSDIFVVEQDCAYSDMDGLDRHSQCLHLMAYGEVTTMYDNDISNSPEDQQEAPLIAYARLLPPGASYPGMSSIGRVIVNPDYRIKGMGHQLIEIAKEHTLQYWPGLDIKIGAQAHLENFYAQHGFKVISEPYLEDGIPHIHMLFSPDTQ